MVLQRCQNGISAAGAHLYCQALAELGRLLHGATELLAQELRAVRCTDQPLHVQFCALTLRQSGDRHRTPPAQMPEKGAFGGHGAGCGRIMQRLEEVVNPMASQRLDSQSPLASGRQHDLNREELSNLRLQSQTEHTSRRHNYAIDLPLAHFAEARVHIPTDVLYPELSVQGEQLRPAA